jgi:hypothetical protein
MMEFTMSRVVLCVCGAVLLVSVTGAVEGIYDQDRETLDLHTAERLAYMLDVFESSGNDELILDGSLLLPEDYRMSVHDGFVELQGDVRMIAETSYSGEFELGWNDVVTITRRTSPRSCGRCR